ncbi:GAF domain-containing protein [Microcoleus sp. FACHB-1515]|uniref:GAF domain-containing sensor histidine kinase n=1 Tax=Cyanophyceae TaxID=3028117 RepID=UPI00168418D8|nr:GAF domain-containing protein [Microcoleus sp. FACHB-1515]MBD2091269.1 GAF domain-containing protein [Microcoleus sp. FACHB-1515]
MKIIGTGMFGLEAIFTSSCDPVLIFLIGWLGCALLLICAIRLNRRSASDRLSAIQLQAFIDNIPARAWIDDSEGRMLYCNVQYQRSSPADSTIGKSLFELYPAKFAQQYYDSIQKVLQTQQPIEVIEQAMRPDGSVADLIVYKFPITSSGKPLVGGIAFDITAQMQTQAVLETLNRKEQTLNRVIQTIRNSLEIKPIFAIAAREIASLLNAQRVSIVQYFPEEKLWHRVLEHLQNSSSYAPTPQDIPDENNPIADRLKRGETVCINDAQALQDDINQSLAQHYPGAWLLVPLPIGTSVWGCLTLQRTRSLSPWQEWELDFIHTVSEQLAIGLQQAQLYEQMQTLNVALEQQVQERTEQLQQALVLEAALKRITDKVRDSLDEGQILQTAVQELGGLLNVTSCDTALYDLAQQTSTIAYEYVSDASFVACGTIIQMSDYAEMYAQLLQGEYLYFCPFNITQVHPLHDRVPLLACPIVEDQQILGDLWLSKQQGEEFNELEIRLVQQVANQCAIALRQSRLYQAAQLQVDELARLNQLKDDFLSSVSHELRTPMYSIKLAIDMLERCLNEPRTAERYMQILRDECDRETELIDNLLDLSRLEAKTELVLPTTIALRPWLLHLAEAFVERTCQQQQTLQFDLPADLPLLTVDFSQLDRILTELLHNAWKYTPIGEAIVLMAHGDENQVQICVKNSGVEIPLAEQTRIFDKFYRIPSSDPWKHGGTGLGLALVKRRVELLGGSIAVDSKLGWTSFTVTLPRSSD